MLARFVVLPPQPRSLVHGGVAVAIATVNAILANLLYLVPLGVAFQPKVIRTNVVADTKSSAATRVTGRM